MSPSLTPQPPGTRYKIVIARLNPDGTTADWIDFDGDTYVVAVANDTPPASTPTSTSPASHPPAYASSATSPTSSTSAER